MYVLGYVDNEEEIFSKGIEQGKAEGIKQGKAEGIIEGALKTQIDIVQRMKQNGISDSDISKYLGLDLAEVQKILKENRA